MTVVHTHKGGAYYEWRLSTAGAPPPGSFDDHTWPEGLLYYYWQHGLKKWDAYVAYTNMLSEWLRLRPGHMLTEIVPYWSLPPNFRPAKHRGAGGQPVAGPSSFPGGTGSSGPSPPQFGYDADQWGNTYLIVRVGYDLHAPGPAIVAGLLLGYGENSFHTEGCNGNAGCGCSRGCCGMVQIDCAKQAEHDYHDVAYWMRRAYVDGFWSHGGLINLSKQYHNEPPGYWVNLCQGAYSDFNAGAQYYDAGLPRANELFNYWYPRVSHGASAPVGYHRKSPQGFTVGSFSSLIPGINWAGNMDNIGQTIFERGDSARKNSRRTREHVTGVKLVGWK